MPKRPIVAIYARVSTSDKGQNPENQLRELRAWCRRSGYRVAGEYVEHESGRKGAVGRVAFARLFEDGAKRKFSLVVFWSLDRFSREGLTQTVMYLRRLDSYGIGFHSYTEPFLSTDNELTRDILLAVFASLAKAEAVKISERTKAGLARARAEGKQIGRPRLTTDQQERLRNLAHNRKQSISTIASEVGVSYGTAWRYIRSAHPHLRSVR
jgi:DNA invertase Pin-like site-specific DNA recombinase